MTEIGLTKSERRYYEIGYDAGFKQSRIETIRELERRIRRFRSTPFAWYSDEQWCKKDTILKAINSMKDI